MFLLMTSTHDRYVGRLAIHNTFIITLHGTITMAVVFTSECE